MLNRVEKLEAAVLEQVVQAQFAEGKRRGAIAVNLAKRYARRKLPTASRK
jgi:hypothetical protein